VVGEEPKKEGIQGEKGDGRRTAGILLAEELAHARLPSPALVERHASVLGAAPGEPRALPPEHVNELLLAQVAHLLVDEGRRGLDRREKKNISSCCYMLRSITVKFTCFMSSW